jgi:hypothetical protein
MKDYNPNSGENQVFYSGNADGNAGTAKMDSAGVMDGLSMIEKCNTKDYAGITENQRPMSESMTSGSFKIGY